MRAPKRPQDGRRILTRKQPGSWECCGIINGRNISNVSLDLSESAVNQINEYLSPVSTYPAVIRSRQLINHIHESSTQRDGEYWELVFHRIYNIVSISQGIERHLLIAIHQLVSDSEIFTEDSNEIFWSNEINWRLSDLGLKDGEKQEIAGTFEETIDRFNGIIEAYEKKLENYSPDIDLERITKPCPLRNLGKFLIAQTAPIP
jgi:hypothetical protein